MTTKLFKPGDIVKHKVSDTRMVVLGPLYEVPNRAKYTRDEKGEKSYNAAYAKAVQAKKIAGYRVRMSGLTYGTFTVAEFQHEELEAI